MNYQIKIKETTEKEISINFPMYVESPTGIFKYAILSDKKVISVSTNSIYPNSSVDIALSGGYNVITEKQFCDFYKETATAIWEGCESFLDMIEEKRHDAQVDFEDPAADEMEYQKRQSA